MTRRQMLNIINNINVYEKIDKLKNETEIKEYSLFEKIFGAIYNKYEKHHQDKTKCIVELHKKIRH